MVEREGDPNPDPQSRETEFKQDVSSYYANQSPEEFQNFLLSTYSKDEELYLHLHVSEANSDSVTFLMNNFPKAKVEIAADNEDYEKLKNLFPISVEWKIV